MFSWISWKIILCGFGWYIFLFVCCFVMNFVCLFVFLFLLLINLILCLNSLNANMRDVEKSLRRSRLSKFTSMSILMSSHSGKKFFKEELGVGRKQMGWCYRPPIQSNLRDKKAWHRRWETRQKNGVMSYKLYIYVCYSLVVHTPDLAVK